jgi:hypothetical protein
MVRFIPAHELKDAFGVFGHFYSVEIAPKKAVECRSVLEIVEAPHVPTKASVLCDREPNAVFIMMNPGSSQPLVEADNRIGAGAIHKLQVSLVPTKPDTTQYQVMRIMDHCRWRHVRVLNLSDIRCPKSGEFFKQFNSLEEDYSFEAHSVFSDRRTGELTSKLVRFTETLVVLAWGLSSALDPLIDRCLSRLPKKMKTLGLVREGMPNKYLHPLPSLQRQKVQWVNQMVEQCRGL